MEYFYIVLKYTLFLSMWSLVVPCSVDITKFKRLTMDQLLEAADIVAYGQLDHLEDRNGVYTLYCILKNSDPSQPLPETVTLNVLDREHAACTRPPVDISGGVDVLMLLRHQDDGTIIWHDIAKELPPKTVTFLATSGKLDGVVQLPGFQNPVTPQGRDNSTQPRCPDVGEVKIIDTDDKESGSASLMSLAWGIFLVTLIVNAVSQFNWFIRL